MSAEAPEEGAAVPPSPFPNVVVFAWLSLLEGLTAAGLVVFTIALLEGGELIPDILAEISVGFGTLVVVMAATFVLRMW